MIAEEIHIPEEEFPDDSSTDSQAQTIPSRTLHLSRLDTIPHMLRNSEIALAAIKEILFRHFGKFESLDGTQIVIFTGSNSNPIEQTGFFDMSNNIAEGMSEYLDRIWGMPPYNEWMYDPESLIDCFDATRKVGRPLDARDMEDDLLMKLWKPYKDNNSNDLIDKEALLAQGWKMYWSPERVREYFLSQINDPDFFACFLLDAEGNLAGWLWGKKVNPSEKLGAEMVVNGEVVKNAFYMDTVGVGFEYRGNKEVKEEVIECAVASMDDFTHTLYGGNSVTRSTVKDRRINLSLMSIGYKQLDIHANYDGRTYWVKAESDDIVVRQKADVEANLEESTLNAMKENGSGETGRMETLTIKENYLFREIGKIETFLVDSIDLYIQFLLENSEKAEIEVFNQLKLHIQNKEFRTELLKTYKSKQGLIDLIATFPVSVILGVLTHAYIITKDARLEPLLLLFEAIPMLGGASSLYRSIYLLATSGIPKYIKWDKSKGYNRSLPITASFSTFFDGGWIVAPLLRNENNLILSQVLSWRISEIVKNLPTTLKNLLSSLSKKYVNNNLEL